MIPHQGRASTPRGPQPARAHVRNVNFARLSVSIEPDLLAAAFRLREDQVRDFAQGRIAIHGELYDHLKLGLGDAGLPESWLDTPGAELSAASVHAIKDLASLSVERAPLRRDNLKRLLKALDGQIAILADALEVLEDGLIRILEGSVKFDDQRMNHINPRLMAAGFPNNWLEQVEPEILPPQVEALKRLANEGYEEPEDPQPASTQPQPAQSGPVLKASPIKETSMASPISGSALRAAQPTTRKRNIPKAEVPVSAPEMTAVPETVKVTRVISREESLARAATLEKFLDQCRRGVKAHLWVTSLGKSASYPAVLKSGATLFNDDLCAQVENVLGLPAGWLANPTPEIPTSVHPWVLDGSLPIPGAPPRKKAVQPKLLAYQRPGESVPLPAAEVLPAAPAPAPVAPPAAPPVAQRAAVKTRQPRQPRQPIAPAPAGQAAEVPPPTPAAAPAVVPVAAPVPPSIATSIPQAGPLMTALLQTLQSRAQAGTFTEKDALKLLNALYE